MTKSTFAIKNKVKLVESRLPQLKKIMASCELCPRACHVLRNESQTGYCKTLNKVILASWAKHKGEEPPISGTNGSGAIFPSNCTLGCIFCQNFPFSQLGNGQILELSELADIFNKLALKKVHNLNFVTPTHVIPMLLEAWLLANKNTQHLPIVYNTSGYESVKVLKLLEGIVDIYLPDIKYSSNQNALEFSKVPNYVESNREAILEMYRQVGRLKLNNEGIAEKGIIIRHLILPNNLSGTKKSFEWIKENIGTEVDISLMCQYFPAYKAHSCCQINRKITYDEYVDSMNCVEKLGFRNIRVQDPTLHGGA